MRKSILRAAFFFFIVGVMVWDSSVAAQEILAIPLSSMSQQVQSGGSEEAKKADAAKIDEGKAGKKAVSEQTAGEEMLSPFENYIREKYPDDKTAGIRLFGYDLFEAPPSTFAPVANVPVGPDYVIGPGDELKITVWGKIDGVWTEVVERDGTISIPKIGVVTVAGLTFSELRRYLHEKFSEYYTGFEMNVSLGSLRTIRVYVVGNARRPGVYTISALSTLINALFEAGGPSVSGTMRDIQVKRNGETVTRFDFYDFLLKGDRTKDVRLMPEDVIFIPPQGVLAGIAGNVQSPAIYELKGETRVLDLIDMAGGLTSIAFTGRVQVQRIADHHARTLFEEDLSNVEGDPKKNFVLQDGDLVKIFTVGDRAYTIRIDGAVLFPGQYAVTDGKMTLKDVISLAGGLLYYASDKAEITRLTVTPAGPRSELIDVNIEKALNDDPDNNIALHMNDHIKVLGVPEWSLLHQVTLSGEVRNPGTYTIRKGEKISSVIDRAGGFTDKAYLKGAMFTRKRVKEAQQKQIDEMVERLERELIGTSVSTVSTASTSDEAKLFQMEREEKRQFIAKLRTVRAKGRIAMRMRPLDVFRDSPYDVETEAGDELYIPPDPKTVQVIGSVYNQTAFVFEKGKDYEYYVDFAGGYTANADKDNVYILKADGSAVRVDRGFFGASGSGGFSDEDGLDIVSGDTIVVPEKLERIAWMRNTKDITQILYQIAVAAGVLIVVF